MTVVDLKPLRARADDVPFTAVELPVILRRLAPCPLVARASEIQHAESVVSGRAKVRLTALDLFSCAEATNQPKV